MSSSTEPEIEIRRHSDAAPWTYSSLDQRQREIALRVEQGGRGTLLLSELAPVITVGRRTPASDFSLDRRALAARGIEQVETDRGGLATYHGPGQWVLFPVEKLERLTGDPRGVKTAVDRLLRVAQRVAGRFDRETEVRSGAELGVWGETGKLAAVGIHVERGIVLHGLSLNVFRTPESFVGIRPCGLEPAIEFLRSERDESVFTRVKDALIEEALQILWS